MKSKFHALIGILSIVALFAPRLASAHCDTMDGPIIADARLALEKSTITPVLKWIKPEVETEVNESFTKTLTARKTGGVAREIADLWFFETLVRLHRAGEGAPYTGLKAAGSEVDPAIIEADLALATGNVATLAHEVSEQVAHAITERFEKVHSAAKERDESVIAGREYVEAYVSYVHFVENAAKLSAAHHEEPAESGCNGGCSEALAPESHSQH